MFNELMSIWPATYSQSGAQPWHAVAPAIVLLGLTVITVLAFILRNLRSARYHDSEMANRGSTLLLGPWIRQYFSWVMQPVLSLLQASGIPPSAVTLLSLQLAVGSGAAVAAGYLSLGGWLFVFSGVCDFLDGRLARATGTSSEAGAVLDSVVDRYVEGAAFFGIAWLYRDTWVLAAALLALIGSMLVPYVRARGESLGVKMSDVGAIQRPERVAVIAVALCTSPVLELLWTAPAGWPRFPLLAASVTFLAASTQVSSIQRFLHVRMKLAKKPAPAVILRGRGSVTRNALAASFATVADFAAVLLMVEVLSVPPAAATILGCGVGAAFNFITNRVWTFGSHGHPALQAGRYALVSSGSAILNGGLVALLLLLPDMPSLLAWLVVRALVFVTWNYPLHRDYVFADRDNEAFGVAQSQ